MVICSVRTRPNRSESAPATQPPIAEVSRVTVPISPASALEMRNAAMIAGIAKLKICTSMASSAQPPKQAQNVRFSLGASAAYHPVAREPGRVAMSLVMLASALGAASFHLQRQRRYARGGSAQPCSLRRGEGMPHTAECFSGADDGG